MSAAPDTPRTPPHGLPAKRGERCTKNPSQRIRKRITKPLTTMRWRSFISGLHFHIPRGLRLAGEDDALLLVAGLQAVLDGHGHLTGQQLHPAGSAGAHTA